MRYEYKIMLMSVLAIGVAVTGLWTNNTALFFIDVVYIIGAEIIIKKLEKNGKF